MYKVTFTHILFSIFIWIFAFFKYRKALRYNNESNYWIFGGIVTLFSVYAFFVGDFWSYYELYDEISQGRPGYSLEEFYTYLMINTSRNYFLWRLIVWGASTCFLILLLKRLNVSKSFSFYIFVLVLMTYFCAPRNTLGFIVMYYFYSFLLVPCKGRLFSYIIGLLGMFLSVIFHNSMPIYILLALLALFPFKRWMYKVAILIFPIIYISFNYLSKNVLDLSFGGEAFKDLGTSYLDAENEVAWSIMGYFQMIVYRLPILIILYKLINLLFETKKSEENTIVRVLTTNSFFLFYLSFLFLNQPVSAFLYNRFWDAGLYPFFLAVSLGLYNNNSKLVLKCYKLLVFATMYSFLYNLYKV